MLLSHTQASAPRSLGITRKNGASKATSARRSRRACALLPLLAASAHAHEGHGLASSMHWHATDVLGFVVAGAVLAALVWWGRK